MDKYEKTRLLGSDFDDTITENSMPLYLDIYESSLKKLDVNITRNELRKIIQPVWGSVASNIIRFVVEVVSVENGVPSPSEQELSESIEYYERMLREGYFADKARVIPGAVDTLGTIKDKGVQIGLATGNAPEVVDSILVSNGFTPDFFVAVVSAYDVFHSKPNPLSIEKLIEEAQTNNSETVSPEHVVFVGDAGNDIRMAKKAGVEPAAVMSSGNLTREEAVALGVSKVNILKNVCYIEQVLEHREF